jgi:hypothetical protein
VIGPTLVPNVINGLPVLRFDGVNSYLGSAYQNFTQPNLIFVVAKQTSKATIGNLLIAWGDSHEQLYLDKNGYYHMAATTIPENPNPAFHLSDSIDHSGAFHNFESVWNHASSAGFVDGTEVFTGNSYDWSYAVMIIGLEFGEGGELLTGDIAEVIRYRNIPAENEPISESDRKWIEDYLSNRYNLPNRRPFVPGPLNIAGLVAWFKADALTLTDGAEITIWPDSSENGHTVTKGTTGPVFTTNILNGHPVARFDGTNWLNISPLNVPSPYTLICVTKGSGFIMGVQYGPRSWDGYLRSTVATGLTFNANSSVSDGIDHTGAFHVFSILADGANTKGYVDGTLTLSGNSGISGLDSVAIGARRQDGALPYSGDIAEFIIYRRILTAHERQEIETWLKVKYATP